MRARASASRIQLRSPAARACGLSAASRGQLSRQTTVAAALADQSLVPVLASRSVASLGNHSETTRFIVPLQDPGRSLFDRRHAEAVAPQLDPPAGKVD